MSLNDERVIAFHAFRFKRSNLSQRFSVTNQALVNLTEWPDVNVPITSDDILSILNKQPQSWDGIPFGKLNRTEFLRQLNDFRYVKCKFHFSLLWTGLSVFRYYPHQIHIFCFFFFFDILQSDSTDYCNHATSFICGGKLGWWEMGCWQGNWGWAKIPRS